MASSAVRAAGAADPEGVVLTEGVNEDRVFVARATSYFRVALAESDSLADLKLRVCLRRIFKELARGACFLCAREASRRVW